MLLPHMAVKGKVGSIPVQFYCLSPDLGRFRLRSRNQTTIPTLIPESESESESFVVHFGGVGIGVGIVVIGIGIGVGIVVIGIGVGIGIR